MLLLVIVHWLIYIQVIKSFISCIVRTNLPCSSVSLDITRKLMCTSLCQ